MMTMLDMDTKAIDANDNGVCKVDVKQPIPNRPYKQINIVCLTVVISLLHYMPIHGWWGTHLFHRELFFFPILMAAFWFGLRGGVITAAGVSTLYVLQFAASGRISDVAAAVFFQTLVFVAVGLLLGWMVDRQNRRRQERDMINEAFGRYVPSEVRDEILSGRITMDGEFRDVTVLFADLRNFTELIENNGPRTGVKLINRYFDEMTRAIRCHGGLVLQFIGDEIEAVFSAPLTLEDHARKAIGAALDMRSRLSRLNLELAAEGLPALSHGIGIHSGRVLAGNIGNPDRSTYALVGEAVNLASRIQGMNKRFGTDILISETAGKVAGEGLPLTWMPPVQVRGVRESVTLCKI